MNEVELVTPYHAQRKIYYQCWHTKAKDRLGPLILRALTPCFIAENGQFVGMKSHSSDDIMSTTGTTGTVH